MTSCIKALYYSSSILTVDVLQETVNAPYSELLGRLSLKIYLLNGIFLKSYLYNICYCNAFIVYARKFSVHF